MTANETLSPASMANGRSLVRLVVSAAVGALLGYGSIRFLVKLHVPVKALGWPDLMGILVGLSFLVCGAVILVISTNRRQLAGVLESEDKLTPATNEEVRSYRLQGLCLLLAGVMMFLPVAGLGAVKTHPAAGVAIFAAIAILFALQTAINMRIWQTCDEFGRGLILQTCGITFGVGQGALFLWAAAGHLHLVRPIDSWECINLLMVLYLIVSIVVSLRYRR